MKNIKYLVLGFLMVVSFVNNVYSRNEPENSQEKAETAEPTPPVEEKGLKWKYFVERTATLRDSLADKTEVHIDRAFIHYGAGAKQAGGQKRGVPQVVYVDENRERLPMAIHYESAFQPLDSKKFALTGNLPEDIGSDPDLPLQVGILVVDFSLLPLEPEAELKEGLGWSSIWYVFYGLTPDFPFPITIEHKVKSYEQKKGRRCAVIEYTIVGDLKMADHPEWFTEEELREGRGHFALKGNGTAYFDPAEGIIVEKEQTISWTRFGEKLWRFEDGKVGWKPTVDDEKLVRIQVSLQSEKGTPAGLPVAVYVLIVAAVGIVIAGLILLVKKKAISRSR